MLVKGSRNVRYRVFRAQGSENILYFIDYDTKVGYVSCT